ncbi:MAG TPA: prolyl oligopeptidase family serine peptidase [Ideonella sp.]|nr:prolyl oligopeptidase family serine peptidase [Ideonella sp.]
MHAPSQAPFGTWPSPISAQRIAAGGKPLYAPRLDGGQLYWLEGLAAEGGRLVVMKAGSAHPLSPAGSNVRSRVHEYGGGAYIVAGGTLYFSNFVDNLVYAQPEGQAARPLTQDPAQRHADFELDAARQRLLAVREDHSVAGAEARNTLVALPLGGGPAQALAAGFDFYAAPRLSPDGSQLAWLCWRHPQMPWNGTELWLAQVAPDGSLAQPHRVAGGPTESLCQPMWSPAGQLYVVSDRSDWWNLYRVEGGELQPVCPMEAEFGEPQWVFGQAMYGFAGEHEVIATCIVQGLSRLGRVDLRSGAWSEIATPYTSFDDLVVGPGFFAALAGSPRLPQQLVRFDSAGSGHQVLASSIAELPEAGYLSSPTRLSYPSGGRQSHAFYYPPANASCQAPAGELPPLLVIGHGGPTGLSTTTLRLALQYWTSRGFAVLDVNYGGSTGFGRPYRDSLALQWGVVDVEDCVAGARYAAEQGLADPQRMAIRGSSAGGLTVLSALIWHDVFKAGASHYGVSDLAALDADTHKFESRYTAWLVAPPEDRERVYAERSPRAHVDRLRQPVIFFQGLDDKVVPPAQSEVMVAALKAGGVPVAYLSFEGEGHGFRRLETIQATLEAELSFYAQVFGFEPAGELAPVAIANKPA